MYFDAEDGLGLALTPAGSFGQTGNGKSQGSSSPYVTPIQSENKSLWVPKTYRKVTSRLTQGTAPGQPRPAPGGSIAMRPGIALPPNPASAEPSAAAPPHYLSPIPTSPTLPFVGLEPGAGAPAHLPPPEIQPGPGLVVGGGAAAGDPGLPEAYFPEQPEDEPAPLAPREPQGWSAMNILLGVAAAGVLGYLVMRKPTGAPPANK